MCRNFQETAELHIGFQVSENVPKSRSNPYWIDFKMTAIFSLSFSRCTHDDFCSLPSARLIAVIINVLSLSTFPASHSFPITTFPLMMNSGSVFDLPSMITVALGSFSDTRSGPMQARITTPRRYSDLRDREDLFAVVAVACLPALGGWFCNYCGRDKGGSSNWDFCRDFACVNGSPGGFCWVKNGYVHHRPSIHDLIR